MELSKFRSLESFCTYRSSVVEKRLMVEKLIAAENRKNKSWNIPGFCESCEKASLFLMDWMYSDGIDPNFRERLTCKFCGLNNRQRFVISFLKKLLKKTNHNISNIYLYEQVTVFYNYIKDSFKNLNVVGSEYLGFDRKAGEVINGIRHEDALNLSFKNSSVDIIISNDVFEHVPEIEKALTESYRILKEMGKMVFTVPFHFMEPETIRRAMIKNAEVINLLPELYHGNPISEKGSLVFYDVGWDLLDKCKAAGFQDAYVLAYYSNFYGHMGDGLQLIFVAEK